MQSRCRLGRRNGRGRRDPPSRRGAAGPAWQARIATSSKSLGLFKFVRGEPRTRSGGLKGVQVGTSDTVTGRARSESR
jgi:hypothetical protein